MPTKRLVLRARNLRFGDELRVLMLMLMTVLAGGAVRAESSVLTNPPPLPQRRELIRDPHFQHGFILLDPTPGKKVTDGELRPADSRGRGRGKPPLPHHSQGRVKRLRSKSEITSRNCRSRAVVAGFL